MQPMNACGKPQIEAMSLLWVTYVRSIIDGNSLLRHLIWLQGITSHFMYAKASDLASRYYTTFYAQNSYRKKASGIPLESRPHSSGIKCLRFHEFHWYSLKFHWHSTGFPLIFHWDSTGISPAFQWNKISEISWIPLTFHRNSIEVFAELPLAFHWYFTGIPLILGQYCRFMVLEKKNCDVIDLGFYTWKVRYLHLGGFECRAMIYM